MSDSVLTEEDRPSSPGTASNSPSPPALVPTNEISRRKRNLATREIMSAEAKAFSIFLGQEEARLSREEPTLSRLAKEKQITSRWTGMTARQRLSYLIGNKSDVTLEDVVAKENQAKRIVTIKEEPVDSGFSEGVCLPPSSKIRRIPIPLRPGSAFNKPKPLEVEEDIKLVLGEPCTPKHIIKRGSIQSAAVALGLAASSPTVVLPPPIRSMETIRSGKVMVTRGKPTVPAVAPQQQDHTSPVVYQELPPRPPGPSSAKEALDLFYLSLCAPAFPHPDEAPLTPHNANFYYEAYLRLLRL